jgi:hypothetical protein
MTTQTTYKYMITTTLLIIATLLIQSCNKPTEPAKESISVTVEDVSCTEAWLKISDTNANPNITVIVKRDNTDILTLNLNKADTVIVDENLLPNKTYTYRAVKQQGSKVVEASKTMTAVTLDTTSHNFTWQTFEFGQHSSSTLYDVAIIDENNIWAVGEIYMKDSLGNYDHNAYNAMHWDGQKWELKRIMFYTFCPQGPGSGSYPARAIFAFDGENIVISSGSQIAYLKNGVQIKRECLPVSVNKIWGTAVNDYYIVGYGGGIAHWNGSSWKKIESGTTLPIMDVYGASDPNTGSYEVLCVSADQALPGHSKILKIENLKVREVATHPEWEPWGIWFVPERRYFHAGDGLWENRSLHGNWIRNSNLPALFKTSIDGQALNDIIVSGAFWLLSHWNGTSWHTYFPRIQDSSFGTVVIKGNLIIVVGFIENRAVALVGRR